MPSLISIFPNPAVVSIGIIKSFLLFATGVPQLTVIVPGESGYCPQNEGGARGPSRDLIYAEQHRNRPAV